MTVQLEGYDFSNEYHREIGEAFNKFSEWYEKHFSHTPKFYITRDGDTQTKSHIDISTSNPARGDSSPLDVLYHFWYYIRHHNLLKDYNVAIASHVRHLHFFRGSAQPVGYYVEKENKDPKLPFKYVFDKSPQIIESTREYYSAIPIDDLLDDKKETPGLNFPFDKKYILLALVIIAVIGFIYWKYFRNKYSDQEDYAISSGY